MLDAAISHQVNSAKAAPAEETFHDITTLHNSANAESSSRQLLLTPLRA